MSLSAMLGGTECGPTNPLQSLLKLQQDRGQYGQQDHFVPVAGSSTRADISQEEVRANREAEAFFQQAAGSKQLWDSAFDLKPLDHALAPFKGHQTLQPRDNWVKDFLKAQQQEPRFHPAPRSHSPASSSVNILRPLPQRQTLSPFSYQPVQPSACSEETALAHKYDQATSDLKWDQAFQSNYEHPQDTRSASPPLVQNPRTAENDAALAQTASELLSSLETDGDMNQRLANTDFVKLMRQIRDYEVVVDGDKLVNNPTSDSPRTRDKGKQRAVDGQGIAHNAIPSMARQYATESEAMIDGYQDVQDIWEAEDRARMEEHEELMRTGTNPLQRQFQGDGGAITEDMDESFELDQGVDERFDASNIIGGAHEAPASHFRVQSQVDEGWEQLQAQWDAWEAHEAGLRPRDQTDTSSHNRLQHPQSAQDWMDAATMLVEHEMEPLAVEAFLKALQLDPTLSSAWLSLAASYSNEHQRSESLDAIASWVSSTSKYSSFMQQFSTLQGSYDKKMSMDEKHAHLTSLLIFLAQVTSDHPEEHADLQVGLGVLFNASHDPVKAVDCFMAALHVRPDDHQLYNRIGAALANTGQAERALEAYDEALRIRPSYARARYNKTVSLVHLQRYQQAAVQMVLALQEQSQNTVPLPIGLGQDVDVGRFKNSPLSEVLWDTLQTCCSLLNRTDLVMACKAKDLESVVRLGL